MAKNLILKVSLIVAILIFSIYQYMNKFERDSDVYRQLLSDTMPFDNLSDKLKGRAPLSLRAKISETKIAKNEFKLENLPSIPAEQKQLTEHSISGESQDELIVNSGQERQEYTIEITDEEITQRMPNRYADLLYNLDKKRKVQYKAFVDSQPDETGGFKLASRIREFIERLAKPDMNLDSVQCNLTLCEIRIEGSNFPGGVVITLSKDPNFPELIQGKIAGKSLAMNRSNQDRTVFILWLPVSLDYSEH